MQRVGGQDGHFGQNGHWQYQGWGDQIAEMMLEDREEKRKK